MWGALVASAEIAGCLSTPPAASTSSDASSPGEDASPTPDSAPPTDAAPPTDTAPAYDAGFDATLPPPGAGKDAGQDSGLDAGQDAGQDAAPDAIADAPPDAPPDAAVDAGAGSAVVTSGFSEPFAITLDSTNLYWTTDIGDVMTIAQADLGGTPVKLASLESRPSTLVVDNTNLYWADYGAFEQINGSLRTMPKGGLPDGGVPTTLVSPLDTPEYIAVNAAGIFWANANDVDTLLSDGGTSPIATYTEQYPPAVVALTADTTNVYWTLQPSTSIALLLKAPVGGGPVTTMLAPPSTPSNNIVLDGTSLYYSDTSGNLWKVPIDAPDAGSAVRLTTQAGMQFIATDGASVYFTTPTSIMSVPVDSDGGAATVIASGVSQPTWITVGATYVYWTSGTNTTNGTVLRAPKP
jgi:hypothetical protein